MKEKIKELLFYKIELPSSTSNKLIINTLDEIYEIIHNIQDDNLHKVRFNHLFN